MKTYCNSKVDSKVHKEHYLKPCWKNDSFWTFGTHYRVYTSVTGIGWSETLHRSFFLYCFVLWNRHVVNIGCALILLFERWHLLNLLFKEISSRPLISSTFTVRMSCCSACIPERIPKYRKGTRGIWMLATVQTIWVGY